MNLVPESGSASAGSCEVIEVPLETREETRPCPASGKCDFERFAATFREASFAKSNQGAVMAINAGCDSGSAPSFLDHVPHGHAAGDHRQHVLLIGDFDVEHVGAGVVDHFFERRHEVGLLAMYAAPQPKPLAIATKSG